MNDSIAWDTRWHICKFKDPSGEIAKASRAGADIESFRPYADDTIEGNLTLDKGFQLLIDLIAGTGVGNQWDSAHAHIGIGDDSTPAEAGQTGLLGANKTFRPMDSTWPRRIGKTCAWRATFGPGDAEYIWAEFVISNGSDDTAVCLNRKVKIREAKPPGETWAMELDIRYGRTEG